MPSPTILTDEQFALVQRIDAHAKQLNDNEDLRDDPNAIGLARNLVLEGTEAGLPEVELVKLRPWLELFDHRSD